MMNLDTEVLFNGMMLRKFRTLQYREVTQKYGLQVIDLIVLRFLSGSGSRNTLADMEKLCLFTKGHLSQSVKRLQESGYLRSETDPKDRRRVHNYLTDKSAEVVADFNAATMQWIPCCAAFQMRRRRSLSDASGRSTATSRITFRKTPDTNDDGSERESVPALYQQ